MKKGSLILFLLFVCFTMHAQIISGWVKNELGEKIPFASVYIASTTIGTVANTNGYYRLQIPKGKHIISFSSIGYQTLNKEVNITKDLNLSVQLKVDAVEIETVQINSKENPADGIIKEVISHRKKYKNSPKAFKCKAYIKANIEKEQDFSTVGRDKMKFIESYSEVYFEQDNKWKEVKLAFKDLTEKKKQSSIDFKLIGGNSGGNRRGRQGSSTDPNLFYVNVSDAHFNFYENLLKVDKLGESPFISPCGNLAFASYKFQLEEQFYENDELIYKIKVSPRRKKNALFKGFVYIVKDKWNLKTVELELGGTNLHYFNSFKVLQHFKMLEDSLWVLDRQEFYYTLNKGFNKLHGNSYSSFFDYELLEEHPPRTFGNAIRIIEDDAFDKDTVFWDSTRTIPLKAKEQLFVRKIDSINAYEKSDENLRKQDSINNRITAANVLLTGIDRYNRKKGIKYIIDPLVNQVGLFGIGGYRHKLGGTFIKTFPKKSELNIRPHLDYGFGNNDLRGDGRISYTYWPKKFAQFRIGAGSKYEMMSFWQPITAIFARGNYILNNFLEVGHDFEVVNGLYLDVFAKYMKRSSIADLNFAGWIDVFGEENNKPLEFEEYKELNLKVRLSYTPFQKYAIEPHKKVNLGSKWPTIFGEWQHGIPGVFGSEINYQFLKIALNQTLKLSVFGTGKYNASFGKYIHSNLVQIPNYTFFRGTDNYLLSHPLYTFQLLGKTHTSINQYVEAHYVHHFNGSLINKIPLLKHLPLEVAAGAGFLLIEDDNFNHSEVFAGLETPFKLWNTKLKLGVYYSIAYSNYSSIQNQIKIGLNLFNPFTNEWVY